MNRKGRQRFVAWVMKLKPGLREGKTYHYVRWTFIAAIAAVIVGLHSAGNSASGHIILYNGLPASVFLEYYSTITVFN